MSPLSHDALALANALLNAVAAVLLGIGRRQVRAGRHDAHRKTMLSAFGVSAAFLMLYVARKAARGFENTLYNGVGAAKAAYLFLLGTHLILAMAVPVLAILLILWAGQERHRRLARVAWPIWMYVSVTGIMIYVVLYHLNPPPA